MVPHSLIQIQDFAGLYGKLRITRKDPATILPWLNGIFIEPAPYGAIAYFSYNTRLADIFTQIHSSPTGYWHIKGGRDFASQSFNLNDQLWGEKPGADPGASSLQARPGGIYGIVFATC